MYYDYLYEVDDITAQECFEAGDKSTYYRICAEIKNLAKAGKKITLPMIRFYFYGNTWNKEHVSSFPDSSS